MLVPDPLRPFNEQREDVLLAMLAWGEARGQSYEGKLAVIGTVLERASIKAHTLKREILRPWAYSCFNVQDPNIRKLARPLKYGSVAEWESCLDAAAEALQPSFISPASGATHYVVRKLWLSPVVANKRKWFDVSEIASGRTKLIKVLGGHVFAKTSF